MASITKVTGSLEEGGNAGAVGRGAEGEGAWGLSPREWAEYTLSEIRSVSTALNNGIAASKSALTHASGSLHHELLQDVYSKISEMGACVLCV